jgi:peptidoglycan/xylan/chitin deacetylase (PgdA/CDA1 family)
VKRPIGILLLAILLGSLGFAQASVTLAPKIPVSTEKVVVVMFDDGWLSQYTAALPILENYSYKASFAIYPKAIDGQYSSYMSWAQIENLSKNGYDVESHTYSHLDLSKMSASTLQSELVNSKQVLQQHGIQAGALIYPYGDAADNATVKQAVKDAGYLIARGTDDGTVNLSNTSLDYYALNAFTMENTTNLAYFESDLYDVSGSNIAILLYHQIDNADTALETVTVDNFAQQMQYLHDNNFTVKTLSDVFFDITPLPPTPTPTPKPTPTATPIPTPSPTPLPTPSPTPTPTAEPTNQPASTPDTNQTAVTPSPAPTSSSTPADNPTDTPTPTPIVTPTTLPTTQPIDSSTTQPSTQPTNQSFDPTPLIIIAACISGVAVAFVLAKKYA